MRNYETLVNPEIEGLLAKTDSKFRLVILAARRARQITSYFGQLGEGLGASVPPQVTSTSRKPVSIALEEVAVDKIVPGELPDQPEESEDVDGEMLFAENASTATESDDEGA